MTAMTDLLALLQQRQEALGLSERALCRAAGVSEQAIKRLRAGHTPNGETRAKLLAFLGIAPGIALAPGVPPSLAALQPTRRAVPVIGESDAQRWYPSGLPWQPGGERLMLPALHSTLPRFAVTRTGAGLDRLYPRGTLLIAAPYPALGRSPEPGDRVLVLQHDGARGWALGAWEYGVGPDGQGLLWPRAQADDLAQPLVLTEPPTLAPLGPDGLPEIRSPAAITLIGVIVQTLQPEPWLADNDRFHEGNVGED